MSQPPPLIRSRLTTPRAAATAGILFSLLLLASLVLVRMAVPSNPQDAGEWLSSSIKPVTLALNLVPFAGIAFLWFIGVVRDRLGEYEDRFFATVFLGSGLLFLAMLFTSAATAGGILQMFGTYPTELIEFGALRLRAYGHVRDHECLHHEDGWRVYDLHLHDFAADRALPALDDIPRAGAGVVPASESWPVRLGDFNFSSLGAADQRVYPPG